MAGQTRKHQEDEDLSPFYQLQKSQVLHEAKAFNDTPLDSRKCCSVLTELLCLLSQGETLGKEEATTLFFGVTKLFQSQDVCQYHHICDLSNYHHSLTKKQKNKTNH